MNELEAAGGLALGLGRRWGGQIVPPTMASDLFPVTQQDGRWLDPELHFLRGDSRIVLGSHVSTAVAAQFGQVSISHGDPQLICVVDKFTVYEASGAVSLELTLASSALQTTTARGLISDARYSVSGPGSLVILGAGNDPAAVSGTRIGTLTAIGDRITIDTPFVLAGRSSALIVRAQDANVGFRVLFSWRERRAHQWETIV